MALRHSFACWAGLLLTGAGAWCAPPDPLDARAVVPAVTHRSVFDGYRRLDDARPVPWRQANDAVERIGGWRSYARESAATAAVPAASAPPANPQQRPPAAPASGAADRHRH